MSVHGWRKSWGLGLWFPNPGINRGRPGRSTRRFMNFVRDDYVHVRIQYRTPTQLGLLERFHQTLKDEEVYWRMYDNPTHAQQCPDEFRHRYNHERPHWALIPETGGDPLVPYEVYACGEIVQLPKWQAWARKAKEELDRQLLRAA